jgi:3-phosphoshikimate 1-carboxyvinyltransferase
VENSPLNSESNSVNVKRIEPITHSLNHLVTIPGSKSVTHRALIISALAEGTSILENPSTCDDTMLTLEGLRGLGIKIEQHDQKYIIHGQGGKFQPKTFEFNFANSGSSLRFFTTLVCLMDQKFVITGDERMKNRPIEHLVESLTQLGATITYLEIPGKLPIEVQGKLQGGRVEVNASRSSQFISSLLLSAPYAENPTIIHPTTPMISRPYIDLTQEIMEKFGVSVDFDIYAQRFQVVPNHTYQAQEYTIEGDFSNAAYFFAATAILGGKIRVYGLTSKSKQGDRFFLNCLEQMGCKVQITEEYIEVIRDKTIDLEGISVDMGNFPDIVPPLCLVAGFACHASYFSNISHLQFKEVDRIEALYQELTKVGIQLDTTEDSIKITPPKEYKGAQIQTYDDHRMVMTFAILGLAVPGIEVVNPDCVSKSFPQFFELLETLYESSGGSLI